MNFKKLTKDFDYVNSDIESSFPLEKPRGTEYKLFHFNRFLTSEEAIAEIEKEGYLPATLSELLLWDESNEKDSVIALSSVARVYGHRGVPELWRGRSGRRLSLSWFDYGWGELYRFLAVRKVSESSPLSTLNIGLLESLTLRIEKLETWKDAVQGIKQ